MQLAMVFPGQGSQSVGMLAGYGEAAVIRATLEEASDILKQDVGKLMAEGPAEELNSTVNTQPVMVAAGICAWRLWCELGGAEPALVAGHSLGEYAALVAAEAISFADCLPLVRLRATAMQEAVPQGKGAMAAILGLADDAVRAADGVIFITPEYNYTIPGALKNAIDWVSRVRERGDPTYAAFKNRAFAISSASTGRAGGLRSLMALRQILELGCGALVIPEQVAIQHAESAFDEMDNIADVGIANLFRAQLERLVLMARLMVRGG